MAAKCPTDETIFTEAVQFVTPARWEAFLVERCAGDEELRHRVRGLLAAHQDLGEFREQPSAESNPLDVEPQPTEAASSENNGCRVGPYKLREQLGEGGMGVVYVAEQTEPVKRKVALKIIKPGMASKEVVARFEAERQALAMMDHPNIAKVHDGGTTDSGQPYFVMELVCGVSLAEYCDERSLTTNERLQIFLKVCRAVQHAHQKGIIHRDLKPSNVLVASIDGEAVPNVIDFGVAKATGQKLTEETVYTQVSQLVGTPLYMSPEQVELGVADVDTRSDVYSLGVLLYELLTGSTPFDSDTLKSAGFDEMRRIIRDDEPPKPSAMVSTLKADALSTIAQRRRSDPRKFSESLSGELDWLVMKALEKDRNRRYESASALANDVERFLQQEPIAAGPPSLAYRFRKYAQRNTGKLIAASLAVMVLLIGGLAAGGAALQAQQERRELTQAIEQLVSDAETAVEASNLAVAESRISEAKGRLGDSRQELKRLTDLVEQLDGEVNERINDLADFERFQKLAREVSFGAEEFSHGGRQQVVEKIKAALAIYDITSDDEWIEGLRHSSLNEEELEEVRELAYELLLYFADAFRGWGTTDGDPDNVKPAEALRILGIAAKFHEPTRVLYWLRSECQEALGREEEAAASRHLVEMSPGTTALDHYLPAHRAAVEGDVEKAFQGYEAALRIQPNHFKTLFFYGFQLRKSGQLERATELFRTCVALSPDHSLALLNLGQSFYLRGEYDLAIHWLHKAFESLPISPSICYMLAQSYEAIGSYDDAAGVYDEVIALKDATWRQQRPEALASVHLDRASLALRWLRCEDALRDVDKAIELDATNPFTHSSRVVVLINLERFEEALAAVDRAIAIHKTSDDPKDRRLARLLSKRARIYCGLSRYTDAEQDLQKALRLGPEEADVYEDAAVVRMLQPDQHGGDLETAVTWAKKAVDVAPSTSRLVTLALAQYRASMWQAAILSCNESLDLSPSGGGERGSLYFLLAMSHLRQGDHQAAREAYDKGIQWQERRGVVEDWKNLRAEADEVLEASVNHEQETE